MSENNGNNGNGKDESQSTSLPGNKASLLAIKLLTDIKAKALDPETLSFDKRRLCVRHLLHEGTYTHYEISQILGVCEKTINTDKKAIRSENAYAALIIDEGELACDFIEDAALAIARLRKQGKWDKAFDVRNKCIETLQSMGYIKKVPKEVNLKGKLTLLEVLDLDADDAESGPGFEIAGTDKGRLETT